MEDRISRLPQHILHNHILSHLSQGQAVRTCILSKSWRHLGPTRPKFEFRFSCFRGSKEKFISVVEKALQRYVDQNLSIKEFVLRMPSPDSGTNKILFPFLNKWIPIVIMNMGVQKFTLSAYDFPLPSLVLEAEFLTELYLSDCKLNYQINNNNCVVKLQMLKRLKLSQVHIEDVTFEKIMSSCPLIEHLEVDMCKGLRTVKVNKARNLKHFDCCASFSIDSIEINDHALSLETIRLTHCRNWHHMNNNNFFPVLKSLYLWNVHLNTELLNNLSSNNCPCLENLEFHHCFDFTEFNLLNRSIKSLVIIDPDCPMNTVNIDVANILYFVFESGYLPSIFSFTTTLREWKSHIKVWRSQNCDGDVFSTWYLKLYEFLKALRQSQISLHISHRLLRDRDTYNNDDSWKPVVVENLRFTEFYSSPLPKSLNFVFRICRPRYIEMPFYSYSQYLCESQLNLCESQLVEYVLTTLARQVSYKKRNKRHHVNYVQCQTTWKLLLVFFLYVILFYAAGSYIE